MKIYFLQTNKKINIDSGQILTILKSKFVLNQKIEIEFISQDWQKIDIKKDDVVILGFSHCFNPDFVKKEISSQIEFFKKKDAQVALTTEYRFFKATDNYYDKDADGFEIHKLAWQYRLPVLDIYQFMSSWYLQADKEELDNDLQQVIFQDDTYELSPQVSRELFGKFIASWLYRKFLKENKAQFLYGASLYPEVWSDEVNEEDMNNLSKVGFNTVRIGEFFWSKLEPEENHYRLDYLENLLTKLKQHHIKVILGIPSPTPPRWFTVHYPEARIVNQGGQVDEHGSRQHVCTNNAIFRRKVYQLTTKIAEVVNRFDNVVAIQLDNEYKCHVDQCFCSTCKKLWSRWLQEKYGRIDKLNQDWGTDIWSESYPDFDSVVMPTKTPFAHNTGLQNAFAKFTADTLNDFASGTAQILIANTKVPITHNTSMNFNLDNYELFNQLDIVGYDTYPRFNEYWNFPINLDLWRNLKENNNFFLLETCSSHVGYIGNYVPPYPKGYLPTEIFLGYAAGLNSILFWPYRAQPCGVEQTHGAIVTQAGTPDLGYNDVIKGGKILQEIKPILKTTHIKKTKVAIVYSDDAKMYMNVENGGIYRYRPTFTEIYEAITRRGISVEVVRENADFSKFNCVIVPFVRYVSDNLLSKFKKFAQNGGKLILGPMTGDRTIDGNWHRNINGLGKLGEWLGVKNVVQYLSKEDKTATTVDIDGKTDRFEGLVTLFETDHPLSKVKTIAPVAENRSITFANNNVTYMGGMPQNCMNSIFWDYLVEEIIRPVSDQKIEKMTDGIYQYQRENEDYLYVFIANMADRKGFFEIRPQLNFEDTAGKFIHPGRYEMPQFSYRILRIKKEGTKNG